MIILSPTPLRVAPAGSSVQRAKTMAVACSPEFNAGVEIDVQPWITMFAKKFSGRSFTTVMRAGDGAMVTRDWKSVLATSKVTWRSSISSAMLKHITDVFWLSSFGYFPVFRPKSSTCSLLWCTKSSVYCCQSAHRFQRTALSWSWSC